MYPLLIIDNNLLRQLVRRGGYDKYIFHANFLVSSNIFNSHSGEMIITPAGVLEYLGMTLPQMELDISHMLNKLRRLCAEEPMDYARVHDVRFEIMNQYYDEMVRLGIFSKAILSRAIGRQGVYTDDMIKLHLGNMIKKNIFHLAGRKALYQRVALDFMLKVPWENRIADVLHAAATADIAMALREGVAYGSARGISAIWQHFSRGLESGALRGDVLGRLSQADYLSNLRDASRAFSFGASGDFLDVEALHYLCVGKDTETGRVPILFTTKDPVDKFLVRVGLFKSILKLSLDSIRGEGLLSSQLRAGCVVLFNDRVEPKYKIEINDVDDLMDVLADEPLSNWLARSKSRFLI